MGPHLLRPHPSFSLVATLVGQRIQSKWGLSGRGNDGESITECQAGVGGVAEGDGGAAAMVYDGWEQCLGETLVMPEVRRTRWGTFRGPVGSPIGAPIRESHRGSH